MLIKYRLLITGANGQLASELKFISVNYDYTFFFMSKEQLDITNKQDIANFVIKNQINIIINCAAYTAVDKAESAKTLANEVNHLAVQKMAEVCQDNKIKMIHISTDYVFDGESQQPYTEDCIPNPQSIYGKTKLAGEEALRRVNPVNSTIIRTSWVYSSFGNNFVKTMLRLGESKDSINVVNDQYGAPTYARDLAEVILQILPMIKTQKVEKFNYSNGGNISWYDFAQEILQEAKLDCQVKPISTDEYPSEAKRPQYSLLSTGKIRIFFGVEVPLWKSSLKACIDIIKKEQLGKC